jgi:hypothetical protein
MNYQPNMYQLHHRVLMKHRINQQIILPLRFGHHDPKP